MTECLCIFEDEGFHNLLPLSYFRPVYDLRCGIMSLREKIERLYGFRHPALHSRNYLTSSLRERNPSLNINELRGTSCLFVNGRVLADAPLRKNIPPAGKDVLYLTGDTVIAARVSGTALERIAGHMPEVFTPDIFDGLTREAVEVSLISYPWHLVQANGSQIEADVKVLARTSKQRAAKGKIYTGAHLINKKDIVIGKNSRVKPGTVLDAEEGPIYIGNDVTIFPNATVEGPAFIGEGSFIKAGAKIYGSTSIGPMCKVGGEVEGTIIHAYANKQHDGFLGHAYLGMWVNLGADTNNSDLKNNYGNVKVTIDGNTVDSHSMFVGLTMGDHSKSAINTMFNTGTVVGVSSNVFGAGFPSKTIPSFTWGGADALEVYDIEKSLGVARKVMARRKWEMTPADEQLFRQIFELTRPERMKGGLKG